MVTSSAATHDDCLSSLVSLFSKPVLEEKMTREEGQRKLQDG